MASRKKVLLKVRSPGEDILLVPRSNESKVIILGDSGVGKTSLMNQYVRYMRNGHERQTSVLTLSK